MRKSFFPQIVKKYIFWGDLTDISAKIEALVSRNICIYGTIRPVC